MRPTLTIHRAADEIGGNCVELAYGGHRILLDAGSPLDAEGPADASQIPATLDLSAPLDGVILSHPHQDHVGLLGALPAAWPVWAGAPTAALVELNARLGGRDLPQRVSTYASGQPLSVGPFSVTPFLTDHSAFDAHMLLVDVGGRRVLYSGDFRRSGRKAALVERLMRRPPADVDVLLLEGTTLGRTERFPTEREIEVRFRALFDETPGRVFVTWSAQNVDRTVTIYRACKQARRPLVLDLYTIDVMERLGAFNERLPRLGFPGLHAVITSRMKWLYETRMGEPELVTSVAKSGRALGAAALQEMPDAVVMLRPSLLRDYLTKGLVIEPGDAWVFSMWRGYGERPEYVDVRQRFASAGARTAHLHTSGHASRADLEAFAASVAPRHLVPIHSFEWDAHLDGFANMRRLRDGEVFAIP